MGGRAGTLLGSLRAYLPRGGTLPADEWQRRHRALVTVLWLNVLALSVYGMARGRYGGLHEIAHGVPLAAFAALAGSARFRPKLRSVFA